MKKLTATIFFLFAITIVVAQPSLKGKMMPDSNAVWVFECEYGTIPKIPNEKRIYFTDNKDTLINGKLYNKFFRKHFPDVYLGAYRNDTITKQVFLVPSDSVNEYLFIDFSMKQNDVRNLITFDDYAITSFQWERNNYFFLYNDSSKGPISTSIQGSNLNVNPFIMNFTEGIGYDMYSYFESTCGLKCFSINGNYYLWENGFCLNTNIEEQNNQIKIELYPNPVASTSTLTIDKIGEVKSVSIYDVFGRKVKEYYPANAIEINSAEFKSGIYFYSVVTTQKNYSGRFLVQ